MWILLSTDDLLIESYSKIDAFSKRKATDKNGKLLQDSAKMICG